MVVEFSILYAKHIELKGVTQLEGLGSYTRKLFITTDKGETIQITLFAKTPEELEVRPEHLEPDEGGV